MVRAYVHIIPRPGSQKRRGYSWVKNFYSVSQLSQQPAPHPYSYYVRRRRLIATHPTNARLYLAFHHFSPQGVIS